MRSLFIHSLAVSVLGFLAASLVWGPMLSQATTRQFFRECHIPSNVPTPCPSVTYSDGSNVHDCRDSRGVRLLSRNVYTLSVVHF
jgi:hypothetical protein